MLLRSRPDTVHRVPSRETQTSTSLSGGSPADCRPLRNITPAIADCRFKVPLPPRLHGLLFYMINECLSSMLLFLLHFFCTRFHMILYLCVTDSVLQTLCFCFFLHLPGFPEFSEKLLHQLAAFFFQYACCKICLMVKCLDIQ